MSARSTDWRDAADPKKSAWVSANAGAGKTHTLANRVTRLLLDGVKPEKILCLTFTKAAAAEMQHRLFKQLGEWSMLDNASLSKQIVEIGGVAPDINGLQQARRLFAQALETPGGLKIQTLHGFCERLLSRFPLEAGVPASFRVLDDQTSRELIAEARADVLDRAGGGDDRLQNAVSLLATRSGEQTVADMLKAAMGADRGKLDALIAGKTQNEIENAIAASHGVGAGDTYESLAADFCTQMRGDAEPLKAAIARLDGGSATDKKAAEGLRSLSASGFGTAQFETFLLALLTKEGEPRARLPTKKLAESDPALADYIAALASRMRAARQRGIAARAFALAQAAITLAAEARTIYVREKAIRGVLDYSDLIIETVNLLERSGAAAWVLYKLDQGLDHILIDEAQDTSPEQWRIVHKLTEEFFVGEGARDGVVRTVFAVGDEKQSIFSFQGADPDQFGGNREIFKNLALQNETVLEEVDLVTSRRSTHEVLNFVDEVFRGPARLGLTSSGGDIRHEPYRMMAKGRVEFWPLTEPVQRDDPDYWMLPLDVEPPDSPVRRLANDIALRIQKWCDGKTKLAGQEPPERPEDDQPIRPRDIMILTPRREPFASEIIKRLKELNVPVAGADRIRLTDQIGVMDLIALGRFALQPEDDLNLASLLRSPLAGFSEEDLYDLAQPRAGRLWSELVARRDERASFGEAYAFLADMARRADFTPPHEFYAHALGPAKGRVKLLARLGPESADAIDEFLSLALAYEQLNTPSLEGFLHWIERGEAEVKRDMERGRDEVRVMTVHGAKGLEAKIVILPDTTRPPEKSRHTGLHFTKDAVFYPMSASEAPDVVQTAKDAAHEETLKEYRRLLYVALTRPRDRIYIAGFKTNTNKLKPDSWYALMQEAAQSLGYEGQNGDHTIRVIGDVDTEPFAGKTGSEQDDIKLPAWANRNAAVEKINPRLIRPSDAAGQEEPASISPRGEGAARFRRGNLIHALLARLPEIAPQDRRDIALKFLASHLVAEDEATELANETLAVISDAQFAAAFAPNSRAEVALVADLPELGEGARLNGRIDRLAVTDSEVLVIDFKTHRPPPKRPEDVSTLYKTQMALYRTALAKIFPGRRIACALVWTEGPNLMPLPDALLDAEIARIRVRLDSIVPAS
jgi:ATP-dependent helicase/nuclease subunit A